LQIEEVRVERGEGGGGERGGGGVEYAADGGEQEEAAGDKAEGRGERGRDAVTPPRVVRGEERGGEMGDGEPWRAELVIAGRCGVVQTPGVVEVRLGVAEPLEVAVSGEVSDGGCAQRDERAGEQDAAKKRCTLRIPDNAPRFLRG
jgi:hypothetical protein